MLTNEFMLIIFCNLLSTGGMHMQGVIYVPNTTKKNPKLITTPPHSYNSTHTHSHNPLLSILLSQPLTTVTIATNPPNPPPVHMFVLDDN